MKKLILCITLLNSVFYSKACGWWPTGDEVRFSLFAQDLAGQDDMSSLFYSSSYLSDYKMNDYLGPKENLDEWERYFNYSFSQSDIDQVIYQMSLDENNYKYANNKLIKYLLNGNNDDAKKYIFFAKKVEVLLDFSPWSKKKYNLNALLKAQYIALNEAKNCKDDDIGQRYAYQFITISYYLNDSKNVKLGYKYFFEHGSNSVLKYWAMLYFANEQDTYAEQVYLYSKIFTHSKSKCHYIYNRFPNNDSILKLVYKKCQTPKEIAGVKSVLAFKNPGLARCQIKELVNLNPNSELLDLLLIREINKIEDWNLTERYTSYNSGYYEYIYGKNSKKRKAKRLKKNKKYLIDFLNDCEHIIKHKSPHNPALWHTSIAYLHYMLQHSTKAEKHLKLAVDNNPSQKIKAQIQIVSLLNLVSKSKKWTVSFQNELYQKLIETQTAQVDIDNYQLFKSQLMIALSRHYLEEGNIGLAALFEGKNTQKVEGYMDWENPKEQVFNLLDAEANSKDLDRFFELWQKPNKTNLETYLFKGLNSYKWLLTDLWGTQYFREEKLEQALNIYKTIPNSYWTEIDTSRVVYKRLKEFSSNPFESSFYGGFPNKSSSVHYTKPQFVKRILDLKEDLKAGKGNVAHNALLLGNAYYNMTSEGNSPYYTEYFMYYYKSDEHGRSRKYFHNGKRALKYYKLAEKSAKTQIFGAFCYRMMLKTMAQMGMGNNYYGGYATIKIDSKWRRFERKYPKHAKYLMNCDNFEYYSTAWKL